ncbi:VanZ like family protein [Neptunomonas antarctica]|uniref:VanZ like family protein n=2 Tax=Neptunomonas antarctica TaxID=619304 RepID=A0A1N7JF35_9GAMM|nr:VanZ like family protein [Neptunomonas antarctica]
MLSSISGDTSNPENILESTFLWITPNLQNLLHIPLFFGLALAWVYSLKRYISRRYSHIFTAFFFTVLYGVIDEYHQISVPGRYASMSDVALDTLGASLVFIIPLYQRLMRKKLKTN